MKNNRKKYKFNITKLKFNPTELLVIMIVYNNKFNITMKEISKVLGLHYKTINDCVNKLYKFGVIHMREIHYEYHGNRYPKYLLSINAQFIKESSRFNCLMEKGILCEPKYHDVYLKLDNINQILNRNKIRTIKSLRYKLSICIKHKKALEQIESSAKHQYAKNIGYLEIEKIMKEQGININ